MRWKRWLLLCSQMHASRTLPWKTGMGKLTNTAFLSHPSSPLAAVRAGSPPPWQGTQRVTRLSGICAVP